MNAARFMAGVKIAANENETDLRICDREARAARRAIPRPGEEGREAALAHYCKLTDIRARVQCRLEGSEPF